MRVEVVDGIPRKSKDYAFWKSETRVSCLGSGDEKTLNTDYSERPDMGEIKYPEGMVRVNTDPWLSIYPFWRFS